MIDTSMATNFLEELNHIFLNELSAISMSADEFHTKKISVTDNMALLISLNADDSLAADLRYCICSATFDAVEGHIALELERRQLLR